MASVKILLRESKIKKNNEIPIYLRIIKNRRTKFISLGINVLKDNWDEKNSRVKKRHKNSARINAFLSHKKTEAEDVVVELETKSKSLSTDRIKNKIMGIAPIEFFDYTDSFQDKFEKRVTVGSYRAMAATIKKLKDYMNGTPLYMNEINVQFIKNYEVHLIETIKNSKNTIHGNLKRLRQILIEAIKEDKFAVEENPFNRIKLQKESTQRIFLTETELNQIEELNYPLNSQSDIIRDMYVFSAYAGGLRVSDVLQLKWNNIEEGFFNLQMQKTNGHIRVKMPQKALDIINKYSYRSGDSQDFVFPFLVKSKKLENAKNLHNAISRSTALINKELKNISSTAEVYKSISFHSARHTFATLLLKKGARIEYLSKILGHSNIKETQIYAQIVNKDLEDTIDLLNGPT